MKHTQHSCPLVAEGLFNMSIIEPLITLDGLVDKIRPNMTAHEVECLQDEIYNAIIDFACEASKEHPNLREYVNVCRQEE